MATFAALAGVKLPEKQGWIVIGTKNDWKASFFPGGEMSLPEDALYPLNLGDDGVLQKTPLSSEQEGKMPRGLRGKIAKRKKEELTAYMKDAIGLVRLYVPPDPALIQKCKDAGNASIAMFDPGKRVRLEFKNYRLPGDMLTITVNRADNTLTKLTVSSYLGKEKDPVSLAVTFDKLKDTITYAKSTVLEAKAKNLTVSVTNSGYVKRKGNPAPQEGGKTP